MVTEEHDSVHRLGKGEIAAFQELVERYKKKIYYLAWDMVQNQADAEDISQEVFLKAFRSFKTFKKESKFSTWLYRITYNTCIDYFRKKAVTPGTMEGSGLEAAARVDPLFFGTQNQDPALTAEQELLQNRIEQALQKVSIQEKAVFLLRHYNDLMIKDIAEVLGLTQGSVKSYLFRAVKKIQKELAVSGTDPGLGGLR